jgi:molecular chaperone IbpA
MRTYDFAPLWRSTVGFDRLFDLLDQTQHRPDDNYPPYNIERLGEDRYQISLALAGFNLNEIAVTAGLNVLTVEGRKSDKDQHEYLHQGIRRARSNGNSILPITSRSRRPHLTTACCGSNSFAKSPRL